MTKSRFITGHLAVDHDDDDDYAGDDVDDDDHNDEDDDGAAHVGQVVVLTSQGDLVAKDDQSFKDHPRCLPFQTNV